MSNRQLSAPACQKEVAMFEHVMSDPSFHACTAALRRLALGVAALVACIGPATGQAAHEHHKAALGAVHFDVSCAAEVSDDFDAAVALLHHMQYEESRAAFERIAEADAKCGMAHWGIAMTLFQPLWPERPGPAELQRGREEVRKARELGTGTDREADLVTAVAAFFREPDTAEWWTRVRHWSEAMNRAYTARPDDMETAALYALSQLAVGQVAPDRMAYQGRAAAVLLGLYEREPTHPGAIHYTIHANDVDTRAGESLEVVRSYSNIAPEVPHALHMPTHIFVRLGKWPEVIEWNRKSAAAALRFPAADGISHHYPHALDYLVYAYLQRGEDEPARVIVEEVLAREEPFQATFISAFHLAAMPARYAVERRVWDEARAVTPVTPASVAWERFWWPESLSWFARGLGAVHGGDAGEAERAERRMIELRDAARAAGEEGFADYIEVDRRVLAAWRAHRAGQSERALDLAREAVRLETATQKHPVTPGALYPAHEALGDLLLDLKRPQEALAAYEGSLATWPGRFNSLVGAARAARAAGLDNKAHDHYRALLEVSSGADSNRPAVAEARQFLGE
jgi:tetratricopeptide (TPR) repeat protein